MKRLVLRLSVLSVVVALGLIAIAQARHGQQQPADAAQQEAPADLPTGTPGPLVVEREVPAQAQREVRAKPPSSGNDQTQVLRALAHDVPSEPPSRLGHRPPQHQEDDNDAEFPPASLDRSTPVRPLPQDAAARPHQQQTRLTASVAAEPSADDRGYSESAQAVPEEKPLPIGSEDPSPHQLAPPTEATGQNQAESAPAGAGARSPQQTDARRQGASYQPPSEAPSRLPEQPVGGTGYEDRDHRQPATAAAQRERFDRRPMQRESGSAASTPPRTLPSTQTNQARQLPSTGIETSQREPAANGQRQDRQAVQQAYVQQQADEQRYEARLTSSTEPPAQFVPDESARQASADLGAADSGAVDSGAVDLPGDGQARPGARHLEGPQTPNLLVQKLAPAEVQVGKQCTFEVLIRNVGQQVAAEVQVIDRIPKGTRLVGTTPKAEVGNDGSLLWNVGQLAAGGQSKVQVHLMPVSEGDIGSVATVQFQTQASVRTTATKPELTLRTSASPTVMAGDEVKLQIELSNPGTGVATGVMLLENIPEGLKHPAGNSIEFEVGNLAPGESRKLELTLTAAQAGRVRNVLVAQADGNLQVQDAVELEVIAPDLNVRVEGPKRRYLDRPATYSVVIDNPGTASARDIQLSAHLPQGMKFVKANNAGQYDARTHTVIWGLEELPAGQAGAVELVALPLESGEQSLRAEVTGDQDLFDEDRHSVTIEGLVALLFEVVDVNDPVEVGGQASYEIRVLNQGSKAASDVQVAVLLPPDMKPVAADGPTTHTVEPGRVAFAPLGKLAPKADTTFHLKVQALRPGDQRVRVQVSSAEVQAPITKEESTRVYSDQ